MAAVKGPATKQDVEVRIGRDVVLNVNLKDETGAPYAALSGKTAVWSFGVKKATPLLTRRSTDVSNAIQLVPDEFRVTVPIRAADTLGKTPSSPSLSYWHELMLIDEGGNKVNTTEGHLLLIEASSN
jgi:hypothetical protein